MKINCINLTQLYKSQRKLYIGLKHLVDDEVKEALDVSDAVGAAKALELENLYHLTHVRNVLHAMYKLMRKNLKNWRLKK